MSTSIQGQLSYPVALVICSALLSCAGGQGLAEDADLISADASALADAATAQGDGGSSTADAAPPIVDAGLADAFVSGLACNPVTQTGCLVGEKCAQLIASDQPFLASTSCVPDGSVIAGGACTQGAPGANGYDDCIAGYDCLRGVCTEICTSAGGDTCRTPQEGFGEGSYCTLYADLFSDEIGLCVSACDPTDDATASSVVTNTDCGPDNGCFLNVGRGVAACAGVPAGATAKTQDDDCHGPAAGSCYLNGCASGYAPILPNAVGQAATTNTCSRYCTPADTHTNALADAAGADGKCEAATLNTAGSAVAGTYQCRFVQSLYGEDAVPASVGMCVPTVPWYDCTTFDWDGIMAAVTGAANPEDEFNLFCYGTTTPDPQDPIGAHCEGIGFGCLSQVTRQQLFDLLP